MLCFQTVSYLRRVHPLLPPKAPSIRVLIVGFPTHPQALRSGVCLALVEYLAQERVRNTLLPTPGMASRHRGRRRGRRRYSGLDGLVQAQLVVGDADGTLVRRHSCRRACALVAWTVLSKHQHDATNGVAPERASAGTPTLRTPRPRSGREAGGEGIKAHANLSCTGKPTEGALHFLNSLSQVGYKLWVGPPRRLT